MIIGHGGNIGNLAETLGCDPAEITDMSSNLNPLGPPEMIERAIRENLHRIRSLPEPDAAAIRKGFAAFHGINPAGVVAGNGTTFFIYTLPKALESKQVLIAGPTYSDYEDACRMYGIDFKYFLSTRENLFEVDIDTLSKAAGQADTVFICNPNNPTGALVSRERIEYLVKAHPRTVFIVDESYLPFVDEAEDLSLVSQTAFDNLVVLSSMSKIFRIPGLRSGFLSATPALAAKCMAYYQPWSVNALAQAVMEHVFDHPEEILPFYRETRAYIRAEKDVFIERLGGVSGLELYVSSTYFLLARLTEALSSAQFCRRIGQEKILIRDCANFHGLSDAYVRFSLKERATNERLVEAIQKAVNHV